MKHQMTPAWDAYEAGKEYKRRIGFYETLRQNERFYRGDQWQGIDCRDVPTPVFNLVRRIVDYLVSSAAPEHVSVCYTDENVLAPSGTAGQAALSAGTAALTRHAGYVWERSKMNDAVYAALLDAALCGDGVFCAFWDPDRKSGQPFEGEIVTKTVDASCLFPADVNNPDLQSQEYLILSGRCRAAELRREAAEAGLPPDEIKKILPDSPSSGDAAGDLAAMELNSPGDAKATWLLRFFRENGRVVWEKSTKSCVLRRVVTPLTRYPIARFSWYPSKNGFHGTSPVTGLVPNQKFINKAYSMVMKHMMDTAFSKVVYDKAKIPEWTNDVGEAIGIVGGGGSVADSVSVIGTGRLEEGYLELIDSAVRQTKELCGATDAALGNVTPDNTSAIITLQEASALTLGPVRASLSSALEDLANIWSEMMVAYYAPGRRLPYYDGEELRSDPADYELLRSALLRARVDITAVSRYAQSLAINTLNTLLEGGFITFEQYLERIPDTVLPNKYGLLPAKKQ